MPTQNFFYRKDGLLKKIDLGDIVFIEAANNYSKFLTPDGFIMVRVTLDAALNLLPEYKFVRIHRSFAVSVDHIDVVGRESVKLLTDPKLEIPVSKKYYAEIIEKIVILESGSTDSADQQS